MQLRNYITSDCAQLARLFYETVHSVNAKDYTKEQLNVWATDSIDLEQWNNSFLKHITIIAIEDNKIIGFGDIDKSGYLDRLYVHKDYQGIGTASAICDKLEMAVNKNVITTHASITARPFFEHRGYHIIKQQTVIRGGIPLTNYVMKKVL